jgi:hypothetical protein
MADSGGSHLPLAGDEVHGSAGTAFQSPVTGLLTYNAGSFLLRQMTTQRTALQRRYRIVNVELETSTSKVRKALVQNYVPKKNCMR